MKNLLPNLRNSAAQAAYLKHRLETAGEFPKVQREFDLYSWQMFLALNWPTNNLGQPAPHLTDTRWPTVPAAAPATWNGGLAAAMANKPGGQPTPVFLTNITMET